MKKYKCFRKIVLTNKDCGVIIGERRRLSPMDSSEFTIQYVGGMANVRTCDESLYHRV